MLRSSQHRSRFAMAGSPTSSRRVTCLGFISPRSAALLLAVFGLLAHIQQINYLNVLYDTFPHVPNLKSVNVPLSSTSLSTGTLEKDSTYSQAMLSANVVLDSEVNNNTINSNNTKASFWKEAAAIRPVRWFNLLPSRYQQSDANKSMITAVSSSSSSSSSTTTTTTNAGSSAFVEQDWKARQRDQEEDRKSWEAARTLTKVVQLYAVLCAFTCICGIVGVIRSNILCTRIFVLSSTLDLFLCALSLVSFGIIVTYPSIRALICEELSNTSTVILDLDETSSHNLRSSTGPVLLLGRAASTFWKRTMSDSNGGSGGDSLSSAYWWDSLLDNVMESENCDDVLESVLIPIGLVASLIYLALRIHFLIVIRNYYVSLLREQMSYHLSSHGSLNTNHSSERKYSSSSASSSTTASDFASCLPSSSKFLRFEDSKLVNEKMA